MDSLRRGFLWKGQKGVSGGLCLVSWKQVCKQKSQGGLGVLNLKDFNLALLGKWWWRLLDDNYYCWKDIILNDLYKRRLPLHEAACLPQASPFWKGILKASKAFKCCSKFNCRSGKWIRFWTDSWLTKTPLKVSFLLSSIQLLLVMRL